MALSRRRCVALAAALLVFAAAQCHVKLPPVPQQHAAGELAPFLARVVDFGVVAYEGPINVRPTIERIRRGEALRGRADGRIFWNVERRLPVKADEEYYREFVHWDEAAAIKGVAFPGPQRLVIGKGGEVYYSGDHYLTWWRLR